MRCQQCHTEVEPIETLDLYLNSDFYLGLDYCSACMTDALNHLLRFLKNHDAPSH
jgi:hypothetical protein